MTYQLKTAVWEITMACNMRCGHCGSACSEKLPDELNTDEALHLCDALSELGLKQMTLSGGEPLLREDWPVIAKQLSDNGVSVNLISNGWLIGNRLLDTAMESGISNIGISLDGLEDTHDIIRKKGAFSKAVRALSLMKERSFSSAVVTTVMKQNIHELPGIRKVLEGLDVGIWQIQIGLPMGNLQKGDTIEPSQVDTIIDFAHSLLDKNRPKPFIGDSVGYHTEQSAMLLRNAFGDDAGWKGCQAGKSNIGILHDGIILGCTSIRDEKFVEGNIRKTPLREIWNNPDAFSWNRHMNGNELTGFCGYCRFKESCLGGCSNTKLCMTGDLKENTFCAYRNTIEELIPKIDSIEDTEILLARAVKAESLGLYEIALICLERAEWLSPDNVDVLKLSGFIHYKLGMYDKCIEKNKKALQINGEDAAILCGLGIGLSEIGKMEEAVNTLKQAITLTDQSFMDPYYDLAAILIRENRKQEAIEILDQGCKKSDAFLKEAETLYSVCKDSV